MTNLSDPSSKPFNPVSIPDFLHPTRLRQLQLQKLQSIVDRAWSRVPAYRERMEAAKVTPQQIKTLDDIRRLPFMYKTDLRDNYPFGLFASPMDDIVRLHASSGTTGKPIVVAYTSEDVAVWAEVMCRTFAACGVHQSDVLQNAYGYGLFTGGLGAHYGGEALGATVIPVSGGNTDRQLTIMQDFSVNAISCTPSYFLHILDRAKKLGVDVRSLPLRIGILGAEPWTEQMRAHIEQEANIKAYDIYGLSEIIGPGVGSECETQCGLHVFEDHFYPEIIDTMTGENLPDGEEGELVLSTLSKQAMPMLRYRTRDITTIIPEPCSCGRTLRRIQRIGRRVDDMLIIRGVNLFPSQIEAALLTVESRLPHYQLVLKRYRGLDQLEVQVELTTEMFSDQMRDMERLQRKFARAIQTSTGLSVDIRLVEPNKLARSEGKAQRVIDLRDQ